MASLLPCLFFIPIICQNVLSQVIPIGNGCFCTKPPVPQKQLINHQLPYPGCNCQNSNSFPFNNLQINNVPLNKSPVVNGLQINNGLALNLNNRPQLINPPNFNLPIVNNLPNNVPVYKNMPLANLPIFNNVPFNLPNNNLAPNALQINNLPAGNRLPAFNNVYNSVPQKNNMPNNLNLIPNFIQVPNANPMSVFNNVPFQNNNVNKQLQNYNVIQANNYPIGLPNNIQYTNLPLNQPNSVQFTNVPNGFQFNQLPNANQQSFRNVAVNNDCGYDQSLSVLFENPGNGLANSGNNLANSNIAPVVSMNGLQLGGVGGLGNLPLFNGLPVIGVQESVVNLNNNNQCACQN